MRVQEILQTKGHTVYSIPPDESLSEVVDKLVQFNVGSLLVCEQDERMVGIITERDILRACAARRTSLEQLRVRDHMTTDVITGTSDEKVSVIMGLMTEHRIRHLPVIDNGKLAGIISIGDVVKAQHDKLSMENHFLKSYIQS